MRLFVTMYYVNTVHCWLTHNNEQHNTVNCSRSLEQHNLTRRTFEAYWNFFQSSFSQFFPIVWYRSLDLNPCGFFLWDHLKANVFILRPTRLSTIWRTPFEGKLHWFPLLCPDAKKVRENFKKRLESCMADNGAHMPDIIFKR